MRAMIGGGESNDNERTSIYCYCASLILLVGLDFLTDVDGLFITYLYLRLFYQRLLRLFIGHVIDFHYPLSYASSTSGSLCSSTFTAFLLAPSFPAFRLNQRSFPSR
jgi:hypothetical protein